MANSRIIETVADIEGLARYLAGRKLPLSVSWTQGSKRSLAQNSLVYGWYLDVANQRDDMTPDDVRAECKLIFGVPILLAENVAFAEVYNRVLAPLPYEAQLEFIKTTKLPVTSIMTMKQKSTYLDKMWDHFVRQQGFVLRDPVMYGLQEQAA